MHNVPTNFSFSDFKMQKSELSKERQKLEGMSEEDMKGGVDLGKSQKDIKKDIEQSYT